MPPLTDEQTRRNVIRGWLSGIPRDTIAAQNNIGAGTVSSIIANYKAGLENLDFDSIRQLSVEIRQNGWNISELASHARLYNYFIKSGAAEDKVESFITNINSGYIPPGKAIELINQIHDITKSQSVSPEQLQNYVKEKYEQKKEIDHDIQQADAILQSKIVTIEASNGYLKLSEELDKHGLSVKDIDKLLNVLNNARQCEFDPKIIIRKLRNTRRIEKKHDRLKDSCVVLSKQLQKYEDIVPLTEDIAALGIGIDELIALKAAINQAVKLYNLPPLAATLRIIEDIKKFERLGGLERELHRLSLQKFAITEACARQAHVFVTAAKMQNLGLQSNEH
jgi:hypothetical protein